MQMVAVGHFQALRSPVLRRQLFPQLCSLAHPPIPLSYHNTICIFSPLFINQ